jgi:hypothetical protein
MPRWAKVFAELKPRDRALLWLAYAKESRTRKSLRRSVSVDAASRLCCYRARRRLRDLLQSRGLLVNS